MLKTTYSGVVLDGFFMESLSESGEPLVRLVGDQPSDGSMDSMLEVLTQVCRQLPSDLPRFLTGVWQPDEVVKAVCAGVDLFDGSLPFRLSRSGLAWIYPTTNKDQQPWIQFPLADSGLDDSVIQQPIQPNACSCFACQRHTRVYISHLHSVNEMLAHILLMMQVTHIRQLKNHFRMTISVCFAFNPVVISCIIFSVFEIFSRLIAEFLNHLC